MLTSPQKKRILPPFTDFFKTEQSAGIVLIFCTLISIIISNLSFGEYYISFWKEKVGISGFGSAFKMSIEHWINDGLMAVFFLVVGLEIKRELVKGELSSLKKASLPLIAAMGGMLIPALIYFTINKNSGTMGGWGIPMATDIAFALGILSLFGRGVPTNLKVFLTALAIVDDLGAILVIAIFYSHGFAFQYLMVALMIFVFLLLCNRMKITTPFVYGIGGIFLWYFMLKSGVHATISGVLLALTIPMIAENGKHSMAEKLEHNLHRFSSFVIIPLFALANTCIVFDSHVLDIYGTPLGLGIILGLFVGKPLGIAGFSWLAVKTKIAKLPKKVSMRSIVGIGFLGGIGFTMSILISVLAFDHYTTQNIAKIAVLSGSLLSGIIGYLFIFFWLKNKFKYHRPRRK